MRNATKIWTHRSKKQRSEIGLIRFLYLKWIRKKCPHFCRCCKFFQDCRDLGFEEWCVY